MFYMANMNIKTEKILSPSNIRRIIMLGVGLRDELNNMELGLISERKCVSREPVYTVIN